jgi:hypothetical protein
MANTTVETLANDLKEADRSVVGDAINNDSLVTIIEHAKDYAEAIERYFQAEIATLQQEVLDSPLLDDRVLQIVLNSFDAEDSPLNPIEYIENNQISAINVIDATTQTISSSTVNTQVVNTTNHYSTQTTTQVINLQGNTITAQDGVLYINGEEYPYSDDHTIDTLWLTGTLPAKHLCDCASYNLLLNGAPYFPVPDVAKMTHWSIAFRVNYTGTLKIELLVNEQPTTIFTQAVDTLNMVQLEGSLLVNLNRGDLIRLRTTTSDGLTIDDCAMALRVEGTRTVGNNLGSVSFDSPASAMP